MCGRKHGIMKVLVYTNLFPNHLQQTHGIFTAKRMGHFAKLRACEIRVVAPVPYCPPWPFLGKRYEFSQIKKKELVDGIEVYHPRHPLIPKVSMWVHGLSLFLSSLNLVKRIHKDFPFDLIDSHYVYPDGFAAILLGKAMKKPVVLSALGSDIHQFTTFQHIKPMIRYALNQADHVITVCNALKQAMVSLGIDDNKISIIPSGVDTELFCPVEKQKARANLSIDEDQKIILSVGSLRPLKGFDTILDALPKLLENYPNMHLYIIGEGSYRPSLEQKTRDLRLGKNVTLIGERANSALTLWYNAADVFCLASSNEGWANVIMESLSCGTPVVATRVGGTPEILTSPDIGLLVDPTQESLYSGLKTALENTWDRGRIRAHMQNRTWFKIAHEIKVVFRSVLHNESKNKLLRQKTSLQLN